MKKMMKRIGAVLLAVAMMAAVSMTAAAADTHTISVASGDTHTYRVYQVLTGTLASANSKELGNPAWGADAKDTTADVNAFITSITAAGLSEREIGNLVKAQANTSGNGRGTVKAGSPLTGLATGYYVLVDETALTGDHANDTKALNMVKVLNDVTLTIKYDTASDDKTIVSDTLGTGDAHNVNGDIDNVSVGDTVNYKIEANVPAKATDYNYFFFVINDTLSTGLDFTTGSIKVYKDSISDANLLTENTDYEVKYNQNGHTFDVGLKNAKQFANHKIIVTYSAVLNKDAEIGETPNKNTSTVQFSNDPNHDYDGEYDENNPNPGFPDETQNEPMGQTPVTETETYTTGIEIQKVDQDGNVLTGATFKISGTSAEKVLTTAETFAEDADGEYWKLKDGTYTKTAPVEADTMTPAAEGADKGYVVAEQGSAAEGLIEVGGTTYRPYVPASDTDKDIYVLVKANVDQYATPITTKYKKNVTKTVVDASSNHEASMAVNENGLARFDGLGAGQYTISETVTPSGYNTLPDLTVNVTFTDDGTPKWSFSGGNGTYDDDEGIYKITVENKKGTQLPETGGIGTYVFYIVGATIMAISAGLLISRRKKA